MNKKYLFLIIIALVIIAIAIGIYYAFTEVGSRRGEINFTETGNLVQNNPGMDPGEWYLVYEKPGQPALTQKLEFTDESSCIQGETTISCEEVDLTQGTRVEVKGYQKRNNVVEVDSIEMLNENEEQAVKLYYYDPNKDKGSDGQLLCSKQGLVAVDRRVPKENAIEESVRLLISGNLTQEEKAKGITTEFPLSGVELEEAELEDGTLTLTFEDPQSKTNGGACRVGILWFQIFETAKQFSGVKTIKFEPQDGLFQP